VALKGVNEHEIDDMILWAHGEGMDLTLIETMPLGDIDGDRTDQYLPLSLVRERLEGRWTLEDIAYKTGGPARYVRIGETGGRLGFITPLHRRAVAFLPRFPCPGKRRCREPLPGFRLLRSECVRFRGSC
jgi:molybdenum cofactor biosynthesis enzyme MoaA